MNPWTRRLLLATVASMLCAPAMTASDLGGLCDGNRQVTLGEWAKFATDVPFLKDKLEARYAIVGTEAFDGQDHYWLEVEIPTAGGSMILQFLVPGYPYDPSTVRKTVAKMSPDLPAMEYPQALGASMQPNDSLSDPIRGACEAADSATKESISVAGGTFDAFRIPLKRLGKVIWVSPDVPFGVVKLADADGKGLELVAHGTDAESSITETPQKIPGSP